METAEYTQQGERLSFFDLFAKKHYKVVIPIIQREYAQGRKSTSASEVRRNFLEALYSYLKEDEVSHDLDFVYGHLEEADESGSTRRFVPLDGQQRLTTLFLLHWYLCQISDNEDLKGKYKNALLADDRSQFTYETRPSSTDFCDKLMNTDIDMGNLRKDKDGETSLSATIKNKQWYFRSWDKDPTIQSMLVMLDEIHDKFKDKPEFFPRLLNEENPVITFLFMDLDKYHLSDDLYIKMNSRGRPLTTFENFKAKLEQYLETANEEITLSDGKDKELHKYFAAKIDTTWTDFFWNYRDTKDSRGNTIPFDTLIEHFVRILITDDYASTARITQQEKDVNLSSLLYDSDSLFTFSHYEDLSAMSTGAVGYLVHALDRLSELGTSVSDAIAPEYQHYFKPSDSLEHALQYSFGSLAERTNLYAFIRFLVEYGVQDGGINEWMRVVANLTHPENTGRDALDTFAAGLKSIDNMLSHANNILQWLKENPKIDRFSAWQVEEEKVKACLILRSETWKVEIERVEKHGYFNGQIGFLLDFAGILPYYKEKGDCDWNDSEDEDYLRRFRHYRSIASKVFAYSYEERNNDTYCFERAVLTRHNYIGLKPNARLNLSCTARVDNNVKRDFSWKRRLRISDETTADVRQAVQEVLDDQRMKEDNIVNSLETICEDGVEDSKWRNLLVCQPQLMTYSGQGFIGFQDKPYKNIVLYGQSQLNHWHVELYTYALWLRKFVPNNMENWDVSPLNDYSPFSEAHYLRKKVKDEVSCITLQGDSFNGTTYHLQIFASVDDEWELTHYKLVFASQTKERDGNTTYDESVVSALNRCGFKRSQTEASDDQQEKGNDGFYREVIDGNDGDTAIECIKQLCQQLLQSHP